MLLEFTGYKLIQMCAPEITEKQWLFLITYWFYQHILRAQLQLKGGCVSDVRKGSSRSVFSEPLTRPWPLLVKSDGTQGLMCS